MATCFLYNQCNRKDCDKPFCIRKYKLEELYRLSLLSTAQREHKALYIDQDGTDLESFKQLAEIEKNIEQFVANGTNLYLHSAQCGNGKTSWAIRFIEAYFNKIWARVLPSCKALFIDVPTFLIALKDNISTRNDYIAFIKDNIMDADLVVWDDIATKVGTEFELNHLLSLINSRISLGKSNIYTSNLNASEMAMAIGERLASRVCNMSIDIELKGKDKRKICNNTLQYMEDRND